MTGADLGQDGDEKKGAELEGMSIAAEDSQLQDSLKGVPEEGQGDDTGQVQESETQDQGPNGNEIAMTGDVDQSQDQDERKNAELQDLRAENARLRDQVVKLQRKLEQLACVQKDDAVNSRVTDGNSKLKPGDGRLDDVMNRLEGRAMACEPSFDMEHGLTADMVRRYSRQVLLSSFGVRGQEKLTRSSVLVVGAGGLGSPVALYLAAAGFGRLGLVDRDVVELNNLHRQVIHTEASVGRSKVTSAASACRAINSSIEIKEHHGSLDASNAVDIISQYDIVVDATDNLPSRYIINDASVIARKPLVSGAALGLDGQLTVYNHNNGPCYRCLFPTPPLLDTCQRCSDNGVLGVVPGIIGCLQALEAIKLGSGLGKPLSGRLLILDAESTRIQTVRLRGRDPRCVTCGDTPSISQDNIPSFNYEFFTQSAMSDEAPGRIARLPPSLGLSCKEYKLRRDNGEAHVLLDVRSRNEYSIVSLPSSINVPFSALGEQIGVVRSAIAEVNLQGRYKADLSDDQHTYVPVYVICRRGNDSQLAVNLLRNAGIESALDIVGGLDFWAKEVDPQFPAY